MTKTKEPKVWSSRLTGVDLLFFLSFLARFIFSLFSCPFLLVKKKKVFQCTGTPIIYIYGRISKIEKKSLNEIFVAIWSGIRILKR